MPRHEPGVRKMKCFLCAAPPPTNFRLCLDRPTSKSVIVGIETFWSIRSQSWNQLPGTKISSKKNKQPTKRNQSFKIFCNTSNFLQSETYGSLKVSALASFTEKKFFARIMNFALWRKMLWRHEVDGIVVSWQKGCSFDPYLGNSLTKVGFLVCKIFKIVPL